MSYLKRGGETGYSSRKKNNGFENYDNNDPLA